jgi:hypothetical protein
MCIADLTIAIEAPPSLPWRWGEDAEAGFAAPSERPDLCVGVRLARLGSGARPVPRPGGGERLEVSRSAAGWRVLHRRGGVVEREASFDPSLRAGEVLVDPRAASASPAGYPLAYPLDEWLVRHRLALEGGLLLHAWPIERDGSALLFVDAAGADELGLGVRLGPQTGPGGASAPRVALRPDGTGFRVHGTPWLFPRGAKPLSARLEAIHLVHPAPTLAAVPLCGPEAVAALLAVRAPLDGREADECALAAVERLVERVPLVRVGAPDAAEVLRFAAGGGSAVDGRLWPRSA